MSSRCSLVPLVISLVCLNACTTSPADEDAGETTNASSTQTDTSTVTTDTDTVGTDDTSGEECILPEGEPPGGEVATITIRNDAPEVRYVLPKSQFTCNYAQIEIDVDGENVHWDHPNVYPLQCNDDLCGWGCSDGGDMGLIINPGETAELTWNGSIWREEEVSEACQMAINCPAASWCEVRDDLGAVEYTARVQLAETCPGVEDECIACDTGVCDIFVYEPNSETTWQVFEASATFPTGAEIVIE